MDYAGNGKINYSEFLAATLELEKVLNLERLVALFKYFDTDNSGFITPGNLKEAFAKSGKAISTQEIQHILDEHDIEKNGIISFAEFRHIFFNDFHKLGTDKRGKVPRELLSAQETAACLSAACLMQP